MINLKGALDIMFHCHLDNLIDAEEFTFFHNVNEQANPEFPYLTYRSL